MHALAQLDAALAIGQKELDAYASGDPDQVFPLVEEREAHVLRALSTMDQAPRDKQRELEDKLQLVLEQQRLLARAAVRLHERLRDSLNASRLESNRLAGYGKATRPAVLPRTFACS